MSNKDGGPAFPWPAGMTANEQEGMSLRDYFAAMYLAASGGCSEAETVAHAKACYRIADAMLIAREEAR